MVCYYGLVLYMGNFEGSWSDTVAAQSFSSNHCDIQLI